MEYRRAKIEGGTYFFTVVTHNRRKFLCQPDNISLLRNAFRYVMEHHPFKIDAIVVLPEHIHSILTLPDGDYNFSKRWRLIKNYFTRRCAVEYKTKISKSRQNKQEQAIWQRRFWEHQIRDEKDFTNHVEYIHYNPVKHGLVSAPKDWEYSSFHRYVRDGIYDLEWGAEEEILFDESIGNE
ncbi:transposase [Planktothrix sp. FACHB-1355]|uniref:Transposase n=1 Tax=Aerosakkonema funiforme FACHB-1375 TaxID=2949571 RepID=A0A926VA50_9CYAN|nr:MULTISPECIES: transposase [Oscillatoriales]MBD2180032.1 transposase [Aerosakkonema funiforme FACHB-1375]MBD3560476.1 transposase [Planktothrix sp. FACHB-1355]